MSTPNNINNNIIQHAAQVLQIEIDCLNSTKQNLDETFAKAVTTIQQCKGKVVVCGLGKSGIVARKIAATFASTGTPSFFMHPTEAYHGDLGMVGKNDLVLMLSHSGETDELLRLIPFFKKNGNTIISISGNNNSTIARNACHNIHIPVQREACPLELAPTASTTATMAMGDAIAVTLMNLNNFNASDFALFHPGGSLGRRLLTKAQDVMRKDNLPTVNPSSTMEDIINAISYGRIGATVVVDNKTGKLVGIITDGDLRRALASSNTKGSIFDQTAQNIMTTNPKTITPNTPVATMENIMTKYKITTLIVAQNNKLLGIVEYYDFGK